MVIDMHVLGRCRFSMGVNFSRAQLFKASLLNELIKRSTC